MGRRRNNQGEPRTDQFGEIGVSQDREQYGHGGVRHGGGGAGGRARGSDLTYQRHIPKFLQPHAHFLGGGKSAYSLDDKEDTVVTTDRPMSTTFEDELDEDDTALLAAVEQDPTLVQTYPELSSMVDKSKAEKLKHRGNTEFSAGKHKEAEVLFSECISLDPKNAVYWSNRAAARIALKNYTEAEKDARKAVELKPTWVKGYARLGAALLAMGHGGEAREALEKALRLEPENEAIQVQLSRAAALEAKEEADGQKHRFKRKPLHHEGEAEPRDSKRRPVIPIENKLKSKKTQLLSFDDE